jgi:hypothetical protein
LFWLTIIAGESESNEKDEEEHQADDISARSLHERSAELWVVMELISCELERREINLNLEWWRRLMRTFQVNWFVKQRSTAGIGLIHAF